MFARLFGGTYHPSRPTASSHGPGTLAYMTPLNLFSRRQWLLGVTATLASTVVARPRVAAETNLKGPRVQHQSFGQVSPQQSAHVWTVTNSHGLVMRVTDYGARLVALEAPDRTGKLANVNLGFDRAEDYVKHTAYFGCTTGRFANRISKGRRGGTGYREHHEDHDRLGRQPHAPDTPARPVPAADGRDRCRDVVVCHVEPQ